MSRLLIDCGWLQWLRSPPSQPRCHTYGGVAGSSQEAAGVQRRLGWTFPWASSLGSDFNFDFNVWFTEEQQREGGIEYNYRREPPARKPLARKTVRNRRSRRGQGPGAEKFAAMSGTDVATYTRERPGMSAFVLEDGVVYHTYSTYARGLDGLWGMYRWLNRAPKGRNETDLWFRRRDEYRQPLSQVSGIVTPLLISDTKRKPKGKTRTNNLTSQLYHRANARFLSELKRICSLCSHSLFPPDEVGAWFNLTAKVSDINPP